MSRILFKILKFWKRSHASWITSIYSDFSKIWCWKISFICVTTSFLDMLKLEKTVHLENTDPTSKIRVHRPLFCQLKFFQYWFIPPYEKSEVFSQRGGNQLLQNNQQTRRWNPILKPKSAPETKNSQNETLQETVDSDVFQYISRF